MRITFKTEEPSLNSLLAVTNNSRSIYYFIEEEVFKNANPLDELEFLELNSSIDNNGKNFELSKPLKRIKCCKHEFSGVLGN